MSLKAICYLDINNLFHRYKKLDFIKLRKLIESKYNMIRFIAYNSIDHANQNQVKFNTYLSNNGYKVEDPNVNTMSNVDPMIITQMCADAAGFDHKAIILIACDGGYSYPLNMLSRSGYEITIYGCKENTSLELLKVADNVIYLEDLDSVILSTEKDK